MKLEKIEVMGMELERWTHLSCVADFGVDEEEKYATLYTIESTEKRKGHATFLLTVAKDYYEKKGFRFGGSVALNDDMRRIYQKLNITEYA